MLLAALRQHIRGYPNHMSLKTLRISYSSHVNLKMRRISLSRVRHQTMPACPHPPGVFLHPPSLLPSHLGTYLFVVVGEEVVGGILLVEFADDIAAWMECHVRGHVVPPALHADHARLQRRGGRGDGSAAGGGLGACLVDLACLFVDHVHRSVDLRDDAALRGLGRLPPPRELHTED